MLEKLLNEVSYRALPESLVEKIEIDVAEMKVGDTIKVGDLAIASDKNVDLMTESGVRSRYGNGSSQRGSGDDGDGRGSSRRAVRNKRITKNPAKRQASFAGFLF